MAAATNDSTFICPFCDRTIVRGMNGREDASYPNSRAVRHVGLHFKGEHR